MLNREDALRICETVLAHVKAAGAEDAAVSLRNTGQSHARFADNRITTSGRAEDLQITAIGPWGNALLSYWASEGGRPRVFGARRRAH